MRLVVLAAEEANKIFLPGDVNEFYWGSAAFLVVVLFMLWKVRPPVSRMIKAAREKTESQVNESERMAEAAESELSELRSKFGDMSAERERIMEQARANAEGLEADLKAKADLETQEMRRRAELDMELSRVQVESDIKQLVAERAFNTAEGVVIDSLTPEVQSKLLDNYIKSTLQYSTGKDSPK